MESEGYVMKLCLLTGRSGPGKQTSIDSLYPDPVLPFIDQHLKEWPPALQTSINDIYS